MPKFSLCGSTQSMRGKRILWTDANIPDIRILFWFSKHPRQVTNAFWMRCWEMTWIYGIKQRSHFYLYLTLLQCSYPQAINVRKTNFTNFAYHRALTALGKIYRMNWTLQHQFHHSVCGIFLLLGDIHCCNEKQTLFFKVPSLIGSNNFKCFIRVSKIWHGNLF